MIAIVDYGLGNIRAFSNIYKTLNIAHLVAKGCDDLIGATKIILPGVGAFDHAMERLAASGMRETLDEMVIQKKIPVLGICVGMQILAQSSAEGHLGGLGWIDGEVRSMREDGFHLKGILPHMGWNQIRPTRRSGLFEGLGDDPEFYFLHSYYFKCNDNNNIIAEADYGGYFPGAVQSGHVFGTQFHPEKSHHNGIKILRNFAEMEAC
ncbi:MAG: imidazole glycerol phosphate synthase subunit HisH [Deltaproteobacteria bacterium]